MLSKIHDARNGPQEPPEIDPGIVDSKRLQMFYASVREGSFAAAAQLLSVSPSAISHAMKALEEDLGCALFRRSGPQVTPTGAAIRLLPMVEDLLTRMSSMKKELAALDGRTESLVFRLPVSLLGMLQTGVLSTFGECFPAADFEIVVRENDPEGGRQVDFDIDHVDRMPAEMIRRDLMHEEYHAYVAPFHGLGQKARVSMAELNSSLLIFPDRSACEWMEKCLGRGGNGQSRQWILPDPRAAHELARQGQGIVFLPEWAAGTAVRDGTLVRLKLPGLELRRICCAWWEPSRPLTWVAEVFLSLLAAGIAPDEMGS